MRRRRRELEAGFTLIELLMSMAIIVIIMGSLSTALIVFLKNGDEALKRDDHSGGASTTSSYFDRDLASATDVLTSAFTGGASCAPSGTFLQLTWQDYGATPAQPSPALTGPVYRAAYVLANDPTAAVAGRKQLTRILCTDSTIIDTSQLIPNLISGSVTAVQSATCASGRLPVRLQLNSYGTDSTQPYIFEGCAKTRVVP